MARAAKPTFDRSMKPTTYSRVMNGISRHAHFVKTVSATKAPLRSRRCRYRSRTLKANMAVTAGNRKTAPYTPDTRKNFAIVHPQLCR